MFNRGRWIAAVLTASMIMSMTPVSLLSAQEVFTNGTVDVVEENSEENTDIEEETGEGAESAEEDAESGDSSAEKGSEEESDSAEEDSDTEDEADADPADDVDSEDNGNDADSAAEESTADIVEGESNTYASESENELSEEAGQSATVSASAAGEDGSEEEEPAPEGQQQPQDPADPPETVVETVPGVTVEPPSEYSDSDELFQQYAHRLFFESDTPKLRGSKTVGDRLTGQNKAIYDKVKLAAAQIADGELASSLISISFEDLGLNADGVFYAEDLGLDYIFDNATSSWNPAIGSSLQGLFDFDLRLVMDALYTDCPYELYWGGAFSQDGYSYSKKASYNYDIGAYVGCVQFARNYRVISILVQPPYRDASDTSGYTAYLTKTGLAASAAAYSQTIVQGADVYNTDYGKLLYFKNTICNLVDYDHDAAADPENYPYRDAWTLIYVFDRDPDTKAVCEGYSEAFQYLCDQTDFIDDTVCAYSVTGYMSHGYNGEVSSGEGHKWNIVHMDDGRNYLADITNSDQGSWGHDGELFLKGALEGSAGEGYKFGDDNDYVAYVYRDSMWDMYTLAELTLSSRDYDENEDPIDIDMAAEMTDISLMVTDKIGMRIYVTIDEWFVDDYDYIQFEHNGNIVKQQIKDAVSSEDLGDDLREVVFEYTLNTTEMTDVITFNMVVGGKEGTAASYSVKSYAEEIIDDDTGSFTSEQKDFAIALLHYGTFAQQYINYNPDQLPDEGLEAFDWDDDLDLQSLSSYQYSLGTNDKDNGFRLDSATLILGTDISLRYYFRLDEGYSVSDFDIEILDEDNNRVEYTTGFNADKDMYYIMILNIKPLDLGKMYNVYVSTPDVNIVEMSYGPLSFCYSKLNSAGGSAKAKELCKALYKYYKAAYGAIYGSGTVD